VNACTLEDYLNTPDFSRIGNWLAKPSSEPVNKLEKNVGKINSDMRIERGFNVLL
jgi:hypothetical protein